jgi:hypothetical protein
MNSTVRRTEMDDRFKKHGAFSWCELITTNVEEAKVFYTRLFGWDLTAMHMGTDYTLVKADDEKIGGIMAIPPEAKGMPPSWGAYVTVDDVDAVAEDAVELGGKILVPPKDIPEVGRFCVLQDPQGAVISAITYKPCG